MERRNGFAFASFVLGLCMPLGSIFAVVFGVIAMRQLNRRPEQAGRGLAIAGVTLGAIGVALVLLSIIAGIIDSA